MKTWNNKYDKSGWGDGPWQEEPDKAHWIHGCLDCLIVRNSMGALCGYVGVPHDHLYYGEHYSNVDVTCHGGLTFSDPCRDEADEFGICHPEEECAHRDVWWLGFDCGHAMDFIPCHPHINCLIPGE